MRALSDLLPRGNQLDDDAFGRRHQVLRWVLGLHVPLVFAFGASRGEDAGWTATALLLPALCLVLCTWDVSRRVAASLTTLGLVASSLVLVQLADGAPASYLHLLAILGFVGLYQDWIPLLLAVTTAVAVSGAGGALLPDVVPEGQRSIEWAAATGAAALLACAAQVLLWRASEEEQRKTADLASELARAQTQIEARESISELFVNLARRNQSLLDRQIAQIVAMEERTSDADALADLFSLDHLATRIRRNAESLLVLSGEEPSRRWGRPVPLPDVVRAAVAEVEDFRRCDLVVDEGTAVAGRAVADLAHLLAELVENGLQFSPPASRVRITSQARPDGGVTLVVEDRGIGLSEVDREGANDLLSRAPEVDLRLSKRLGLHVVSRLASRYHVRVRLEATAGGGTTVIVIIPAELLTNPDVGLAPGAEPTPVARPVARPVATVAGRPLTDLAPGRSLDADVAVNPAPARPPLQPVVVPAAAPVPAPAVAARPLVAPTRPEPAPAMATVARQAVTAGDGSVAGLRPAALVDPASLPVARRTADVLVAPATPAPAPVFQAPAPPAPVSAPAPAAHPPAATAPGGLRRRVPQANLNPNIRQAAERPAVVTDRRSREEVRAMLSRFQAGQTRGRQEAVEDAAPLFGGDAR
jgi:signal transduction histidine kinase